MDTWGTVFIFNYQFKTNSEKKYQEIIYTSNIIQYLIKVISRWVSLIRYPKN